jgi:glycosyltransferase involved in cell wall biosynthesis
MAENRLASNAADEARTRISAIVHTRDAAATLETALRSLAWADEILVVDMASRDATLEIARRHATRILETEIAPRVDGIRNRYAAEASGDWVFVLDADESLADDAGDEIRRLIAEHGERCDAFAIPRFNSIAGQVMRGSGWYPDHQLRLFRKGTVRWSDTHHTPPEVLSGRGRLMELMPPACLHIHHRNYESLRHFAEKQLVYALSDRYDARPESFDFADYVARAYQTLATRDEPDLDGDLSHALALLLAWDQIVRGLVHWESLATRPPLGLLAALPVATERVPWWRVRLRRWLGRRHAWAYYARRLRDVLRR